MMMNDTVAFTVSSFLPPFPQHPTSMKTKKKYLVDGELMTIYEASEKYGIEVGNLNFRRRVHGLTLQEAVEYQPLARGRPKRS